MTLKSHVLQASLILVLLLLVPKSYSSGNVQHNDALKAADEFRNAWMLTLVAWLSLYGVFTIEEMLRVQPGSMPSPWLHVIDIVASCVSTLGFWKCFLAVSNPGQRGDPLKWIGIVCLLIGLACVAVLRDSYELGLAVDLCVGALSGIAMAFFIGRLESRLLRPPRWLLMALYCYATVQFGYGFLNAELKRPVLWQPFFFLTVLLLKILLALFVSWLIGTGNLLFYLRFVSELNQDYKARRETFLSEHSNDDLGLQLRQYSKTELSLKFLDAAPYKFTHHQQTVYRLGVVNESDKVVALNVMLQLVNVLPCPRAGNYHADFPLRMRAPGESADSIPINPRNEERFELLRWWISSSGQVIIAGLGQGDSFAIERDEVWNLRLRISAANAAAKEINLIVQVHGESTLRVTERLSVSTAEEP